MIRCLIIRLSARFARRNLAELKTQKRRISALWFVRILALAAVAGGPCFAELPINHASSRRPYPLRGTGGTQARVSTTNGAQRTARPTSESPMSFEANHGQTAPEVRFVARGRGYTFFLGASEAVLSLPGEA